MADTTEQGQQKGSPRRILRGLAITVCIFLLVSLYLLKIYLSSPHAASRLSQFVASSLHHPFAIESMGLTLRGITLKGVSLGNPPGFQKGNLVTIGTVVVSPEWGEILHGRRSFALVSMEHPRIDICRDSSGRWNFYPVRNRLAAGRPGPGISIARLVISNGAVSVNGRGVSSVSLQLLNLETKGANDSGLMLAFEDGAHDRFTLEGTVRPGTEAAYALRLSAPRITLAAIAELAGWKPHFPVSGTGSLMLNSAMKGNEVTAEMEFRFHKAPVDIGGRTIPLSGALEMRGRYDRKLDQARIEKADISVDHLARLHASGTIDRLRSKREFSIMAGMARTDIAGLALFLPEQTRKGITVTGAVESRGIRISGAGKEITALSGVISLRDGAVSSGKRPMLRGLSAEMGFSPAEDGFLASLSVRQKEAKGLEMLQGVAADGALILDRRLKPVAARLRSITGKIEGVGFSGNAAFVPGSATPVSAALSIPETDLSQLNRIRTLRNLSLEAGKGSLTIDLKGSGIRQAKGMASARISKAEGKAGEKRFGIAEGAVTSNFAISNSQLNSSGSARFRNASYGQRSMDGAFDYSLADRAMTIRDARLVAGSTSAAIGKMTVKIPQTQTSSGATRYPPSLEFDGCDIHKGDAAIAGLSGRLLAAYARDGKEQWLEGNARIESSGISQKGKILGAPVMNLTFSRHGVEGAVAGSLLGGRLSGALALNPFALPDGATADISLTGAAIRDAARLIPPNMAPIPDNGVFDAAIKGSYSHGAPLKALFTLNGREISLISKGGKQLLSGVTAKASGSMAEKRLTLDNAVIAAGDGIALEIRGQMNDLFSQGRDGEFDATFGKADISLILDRFANSLPAFLQEATASGSMAAKAKLTLNSGKTGISGEIVIDRAALGVESQKLSIAGIDGVIPVSFAAGRARLPEHQMDFTRENFPSLIEQLQNPPSERHSLTIGEISFGPLRLGNTRLMFRSSEGLTEITSLRSSLYDGLLLGKAYLSLSNGYLYGADLLMNDLSLAQLCNSFPRIKGYISGRVEGLLSLSGGSQGKKGLIGLTELWTHEARGEKMQVSREFLQKLAGRNLSGFFFSDDRPYDRAEIGASLEKGFLEFYDLAIIHTNLFGVRDLSVTVAESRNRIALEHLFSSIKNAATRGKSATTTPLAPAEKPEGTPEPGFNWEE